MADGPNREIPSFYDLSVCGNDEYRTPITTCCTSCREDGLQIEAVRYCIDCEEYQCGKCGRFHDRYNHGHDVLKEWNKRRWGEKKTTNLPTEKCQKHIGEVLQIYCVNHEELCCHVCAALEHSKCERKKYIPDLAENITNDKEYRTLDAGTKDLVRHLNAILLQSTTNKANVNNTLNRFDQYVEETRERFLDIFDRRANETRKKVAMEHTRITSEIDSTISWLKVLITKVEQLQNKIDPKKVTNKSQLFINLKNTRTEFNKTLEESEQISRPQPKTISFEGCKEIAALLDYKKAEVVKHKVVTWTPSKVPASAFGSNNAFHSAPGFGNMSTPFATTSDNGKYLFSSPVHGYRRGDLMPFEDDDY